MIRVLAAVLLAAPAFASSAVRLALIEDEPTRVTLQLAQPLERVLREAGDEAALVDVESVPVFFGGQDYRLRLSRYAPEAETSTAAVLEGDAEIAFVFPDEPELVEALRQAAADPSTFRRPNSIRLSVAEAEFASSTGADGDSFLSLRARLERPPTGRMRAGLAAYYRLRWKGKDAAVAVIGRTYGGIGRLATAAGEQGSRPFTGLARGGTFGSASSDAQGRAVLESLRRAGLRWASVSASEIEHWLELLSCARDPGGVRWLSANLVYSSAPASTVLPPYAVFEASGARVAVAGLTPPWTERLLKASGLGNMTVVDPVSALEPLIPRLRREADIVVVLADLPAADQTRLAAIARGLDLVIGENAPSASYTSPPSATIEQSGRPLFANAFPPVRVYRPALNVVDVDRASDGERADWRVSQSAFLLDDSINPAENNPEASLERYAASRSTSPAALPDARAVFPPAERAGGFPIYEARDVWTMGAALLAERAKAEAGVLLAPALSVQTVGDVSETYLRDWLGAPDPAVIVTIGGDRLRALLEESAAQSSRESQGLSLGAHPRFVVGGVDASRRLRGAPLDTSGTYRIATSRGTAEALGLPEPRAPIPGTPLAGRAILEELLARAGSTPPATYRSWMTGSPVREPGLWRLNFRDVGLNVRQTKIERSNDFNQVGNSRVQGFDEMLVGGVFKADAEYLKRGLKWANTVEAEYAKSRITPRNAPPATNLAANRVMLLTLGTHRAGGIRREWLARSWGPSAGLQYDGEFETVGGAKRRQTYSLFTGLEFFDGTLVRSLQLSGVVKRDLSRDPPNTQPGLRMRTVFSREIGPSKTLLQGQIWNNYFFLTRHDTAADLRMEGDVNVKLRVPIRKYLSVAPFLDYYWFALKTRPRWGYSLMMGVSIGFSRLWKPQYEDF
ncbi:MAG: hypothetical protein HYZ74_00010 [Elusimicrobia bacterium]|nr:hypothetical protein [Elusimicrobiota bacterium]